jgi:hypothetical protein
MFYSTVYGKTLKKQQAVYLLGTAKLKYTPLGDILKYTYVYPLGAIPW